jgi:XTP/dITP diphosphohydrolase
MKTLLIATHNQAKLKELKVGLASLEKEGIKILTLNDVGVEKKPEEIGDSFCKNAEIKAKFYGELTNFPTIADDGGLIIPYLNNEPGVKSRRWLGYDATDGELIDYTLKKLYGTIRSDRTAYLSVCLCFYDPLTKKLIAEEEKIKGHIAEKPSNRGIEGFPFRALFVIDKFNKYYDELTEKEHQEINHRLKALKRLITKIQRYLIE